MIDMEGILELYEAFVKAGVDKEKAQKAVGAIEAKEQATKGDILRLENNIKIIEKDIADVKRDIVDVKKDIADVKKEVQLGIARLDKEIVEIKKDIVEIKKDIVGIKKDIGYHKWFFTIIIGLIISVILKLYFPIT